MHVYIHTYTYKYFIYAHLYLWDHKCKSNYAVLQYMHIYICMCVCTCVSFTIRPTIEQTLNIYSHILFFTELRMHLKVNWLLRCWIKVSYKYRETKRVGLVLWWGVRVSQKLVPMISILKVRICLFVENREGKKGYFGTKNIYVYICLIHVVVQQKLMQHCKVIILQFKKRKKQPVQVTEIGNKNYFFTLHWEIQSNQACLDWCSDGNGVIFSVLCQKV